MYPAMAGTVFGAGQSPGTPSGWRGRALSGPCKGHLGALSLPGQSAGPVSARQLPGGALSGGVPPDVMRGGACVPAANAAGSVGWLHWQPVCRLGCDAGFVHCGQGEGAGLIIIPKACSTRHAAWTGAGGNTIEDEPRCEADEYGRHRYVDVSRQEYRGMFVVTEQCHECRVVRETAYGWNEAVERRRFYDPSRWLAIEE